MGDKADTALRGTLLQKDDVEVRLERIPAMVTDSNVDIFRVKRFFASDAWTLVEDVVKRKIADPQWICPVCDRDADNSVDRGHNMSLACDSCLKWHHLTCLGKKVMPKKRTWICRECHRNSK